MTHVSTRRRAFTLIEILVVVGIIMMLAALLFPVFGRVRENARRTSCQNNLRQLGLAFQQYVQDYKRFPKSGNFFNGGGFAGDLGGWSQEANWVSGNAWVSNSDNGALADPTTGEPTGKSANVQQGAIFPYVKSDAVFVCPSNESGQEKNLSYSMNCAVTLLRMNRVRNPTDIVLLVDEEKANDGYFYAAYEDGTTTKTGRTTTSGSTDALTIRHNGGGNLLFVDGHTKFYPLEAFPLDMTPAGLENKWKLTGSPRFHDSGFGKYGSNIALGQTVDYCNASARTS